MYIKERKLSNQYLITPVWTPIDGEDSHRYKVCEEDIEHFFEEKDL